MMQQLMTSNRFISLTSPDPDDSDTEIEPTEPIVSDNAVEDVSMDSDTEYFDAIETVDVDTDDDVPYFQQGAEPPPREQWEIAEPIDFLDVQAVTQLSHQLDQLFLSQKEIETPLGMDDLKQWWKWDDVGSCRMPRAPTTYPALMIDEGNGIQRPAASQVHHKTLFQWIIDNLSWLPEYATVYVYVDNRKLPGTDPPAYWPLFAPWIKGRCTVTGPYCEKTTAIHLPIHADTGLHQVHYTWAGAAALEALCLMFPTVNFALIDSDCVPTSLFEIAELVNLMTDKTSRAAAMQHNIMASSNQCPPAVLLATEAKAELNAGLIIVTGHIPIEAADVDMDQATPEAGMPSGTAPSSSPSNAPAPKARRIAHPANRRTAEDWVTALRESRASFLATTAVPEDPVEAMRGGLLLTPLLGCKARTPLDWTHAWAMLGEWAGAIAFPIPEQGEWPRHGDGRYLRPDFVERTPPFLTWARPIFEQGALSPMSVFPADFPILCLPGDKLFQSKELTIGYSLPPILHAFHGSKVGLGHQLQQWLSKGLQPLAVSLIGVEDAPPLWTHPTGCDFIRGGKLVVKPQVPQNRSLTPTQVLLLQSLWTPVEAPNSSNGHTPWPKDCEPAVVFCGQHASLKLPTAPILPLLEALQRRLNVDSNNAELAINEVLASHNDPKYTDWKITVMDNTSWQLNDADPGSLEVQCTGLGGGELDEDWDVLMACRKEAHVYGPSLSKQDDWNARVGTVAGTAHTQEYLLLHIAMFPIGAHFWCRVLGMPRANQLQAQIISRAMKLLRFCPIIPAHRKPPWPGYTHGLRLFTKLLVAHPLVGVCLPPEIRPADYLRLTGYMIGSFNIRGHSAGSYAGMVWETILSEFPDVDGTTVLAAIALPPSLLTTYNSSQLREIHLIHHADDKLCVWNPSNHDIKLLKQRGFKITHVTGWRAYLGTAQHNYSHWTRVALPEGRPDLEQLEGIPGVLPFEVYSQAPLRLISWCSFELPRTARKLLRELAEMCELPETTTQALVAQIAVHNAEIKTEQEATQYLAGLATVTISSRANLHNYTTMVQQFLGTLPLPMAVYMLDYYLPMLSPNEGYNETGLTMQSAGPVRQPSQPIALEFLFKGSEFGHWRVKGGQDAFAFRHPSLGKTDVFSLLASDAHHHKVSPIGTGRLIAMVGTAEAPADDGDDLQVLFGLVLAITPRAAKKKDELAASRIYRQCNPKFIEVAFLTVPAIKFFAKEQLETLQDLYTDSGQCLDPIDATVQGQNSPVPKVFFLHTMWMFGCTKPTRELTAVAQTSPCRYHLGLGIYNVQTAVEGMEGNKRSHFLHLCGQLLHLVLTPCHVEGEHHPWTRSTALSFAAEIDGHVLGTLCAVTMALLTNRLDLCIQGLFGAGKSKSMAILILALIEIDTTDSLKILFICKENSGTRSFADLLLWLDPPSGVFGRIGRLVGDQERNKSSYSHTKFDIHPKERRQMLHKCQLILATGGTVAQDLTMQWSTMGGFMQELSLLVIDEGQQYGTDREIAVISLLRQQPLVLWTGDSEQTPGGIDRAARNAKRSRQLLLAKRHGLRSNRNYYTPATLADAMTRLLDGSANEGLTTLSQILKRGQSTLGRLWTSQLSPEDEEDLKVASAVLPGLQAVFKATQPTMRRHSRFVEPELLEGAVLNLPRSLVRLAWILQHAATLLPMAGDIQATLNSQTAGVSDIHAWGLMLPSSSRVSPVTYHAVVAVRYPALCRQVNGLWELGSFASGGLPDKPPGFQLVLWDTNARINGLVATDLETLVSEVLTSFPCNAGFADGLFTMTTATDHKNNLNRSVLKRDYVRTLRVETIANSAGGTAQVSIVAQPSIGFLNTKYYSNGSPTEDTEDCLGRITVGLTRSKSLTLLVSPLDMMGLMGMAQVIATIAYGIGGLRRGETTWKWPEFDPDPVQENLAQLSRWSLNSPPNWEYPPLAIANQYYDQHADEVKRARYRLILVRGSDLRWLDRARFQEIQAGLRTQHKWLPRQHLPFSEVVLYAYAADRTPFPTYVCLPSGLYKARTGNVVAQTGPDQEILSLPGIYFFDGWRLHPNLPIPDHLPRAAEAPVQGTAPDAPTPDAEPKRSPEEEARDILAVAAKNQPEDGPSTRKAAVRACKYLRAMVNQYETTIQAVHSAARTHTQRSKGMVGPPVDYRPQGEALPVISADLTSELLHCLSTLPDPWPLAKITIDMEKPSQWVSKLCRLYFADEYAKRTVGLPSRKHVPDIAGALRAVQAILPKLEVKMIEFLAEWMVTLLMPARHVMEVRAPHLSFMMLKEYWFRELYLGLKVTASFDRSESYTRVIDGQVRCITPEVKPQNLQVIWNVQFITVFVPAWMIPPVYHSLRRESIKTVSSGSPIGVQSVRPTWFEDTTPKDPTSQQSQDPHKEQAQPLHGLKLVIKEEVLPATDQPQFQSLELLASRGLLAPDTWKCKRAQVSLKATIDVPMLGTIIEQNGDGLLEDSHMPVGWPLHIDGAVRQCCIHRTASLQELDDMLKEYDMKRDSVEINHDAPQWSHHAVWNRKYMEPKPGYTLEQLWADSEPAVNKKTTTSYEVQADDLQRAVSAIRHFPPPIPPDSPFIQALGTPAALKAPPQTDTLAQRALEEWERTLCENKAVAILAEIQAGRPTIIHKDGGEMLIAIVLDKPLEEAKQLVDDPAAFTREMTRILRDKHTHPLIAQMMKPAESSEPPSATASASGASSSRDLRTTPHEQFQ